MTLPVKHIPSPDVPAFRVNTFQSIVDNSNIARDSSSNAPIETGAFRSAYWYKEFQTPLGWNPAPGVSTAWELILRGESLPGPTGKPSGPEKPYLGVRVPHRTGPYSKWMTYGEAKQLSIAVGSAIKVACGLRGQVAGQPWDGQPGTVEQATGDKVAFYNPNSVEWRLADMATVAMNYVSVPIFPNTDPAGVAHMLTLCKIKLIFCLADQLPKVEAVKSPYLEYVVVVPNRDGTGTLTDKAKSAFMARNPKIKAMWNWDAFLALGQANLRPAEPATDPDEILTICFTSGSTGLPKVGLAELS